MKGRIVLLSVWTCIAVQAKTGNDPHHDDIKAHISAHALAYTHAPKQQAPRTLKKSNVTFIVYIAGDNDLFPFAGRNLKQMQNIGSSERLTIAAQFDMHRPGQPKITRRYLVEKNKLTQIGPDASMDSGDTKTLISCCQWAIESYPADDYILVLWNHGTGILEPIIKRALNPSKLFAYNTKTKLVELNRGIGFLDFINQQSDLMHNNMRGICFDDTTGNYLTNQKLKEALHTVTTQYLNGKKFSIIGFDACLMSMIEVASIVKDYAHIMVSSQEVELGTGWDYLSVLSPYSTGLPDRVSFAKNVVTSYQKTYSKITNDYTQSALDLAHIHLLEDNIDRVSALLIAGLQKQKNRSVKEMIKVSRHKNFCTHFDEPTYIDLGHFYANLAQNSAKSELTNPQDTVLFKQELLKLVAEGAACISTIVLQNAAGKNLHNAQGISIYFPEYQIHSSYKRSEFANSTHWLSFLVQYLSLI